MSIWLKCNVIIPFPQVYFDLSNIYDGDFMGEKVTAKNTKVTPQCKFCNFSSYQTKYAPFYLSFFMHSHHQILFHESVILKLDQIHEFRFWNAPFFHYHIIWTERLAGVTLTTYVLTNVWRRWSCFCYNK